MRALIVVAVLLWATPAQAQMHWRFSLYDLSKIAVMSANAADTATTMQCEGAGRCTEMNPWLARSDNPIAFATEKTAVVGGQLWGVGRLAGSGHKKLATAINFSVAGAFYGIAAHNYRVGHSRLR